MELIISENGLWLSTKHGAFCYQLFCWKLKICVLSSSVRKIQVNNFIDFERYHEEVVMHLKVKSERANLKGNRLEFDEIEMRFLMTKVLMFQRARMSRGKEESPLSFVCERRNYNQRLVAWNSKLSLSWVVCCRKKYILISETRHSRHFH